MKEQRDAEKCTGCRVCEVICSSSHAQPAGVEIGLESLVNKYGLQKVADTIARIAKKG